MCFGKAKSKLLSSVYFKIKGNCSLKALKLKRLKENTAQYTAPLYDLYTLTPTHR